MRKFLATILAVTAIFFVGCSTPDNSSSENSGSDIGTDAYYDVVFTQNGESVTKTVKAGEDLTDIPEITESKTGYTAKWSVSDFTDISSDLNVTIVYTPMEIVISYDLGECPNAVITGLTQTVTYDEAFVLYIPQPYISADYEYEFVKWVRKGTNEEFVNGVCEFTEKVELVAVWEKFTPSFPL